LTDTIGVIPTLILSDRERAIKYDRWDSKGKYKSYLAKRIQNKGTSTVSLLNYWNNPHCEDIEVFLLKSTEFAISD